MHGLGVLFFLGLKKYPVADLLKSVPELEKELKGNL